MDEERKGDSRRELLRKVLTLGPVAAVAAAIGLHGTAEKASADTFTDVIATNKAAIGGAIDPNATFRVVGARQQDTGYALIQAVGELGPTQTDQWQYGGYLSPNARPSSSGGLAGVSVVLYAQGALTQSMGVCVDNPQGAGPITKNYGLYIENQTRGGTPPNGANFALYSNGGPVYFAGKVGIGISDPAFPLDVVGDVNVTGDIHLLGVLDGVAKKAYYDQ